MLVVLLSDSETNLFVSTSTQTLLSTRWSPPMVLISEVFTICGSLSALIRSLLMRLVMLMVPYVVYIFNIYIAFWFEVPPTPFLGVGPNGFWLPLAPFLVPEVFVGGLCSCLFSVFSPPPVLTVTQ